MFKNYKNKSRFGRFKKFSSSKGNGFGGQNRNRNPRAKFGGRGQSGGGRRIKTFNPIELINAPVSVHQKVEEYVVKNSFNDFQISDKLKQNIVNRKYKIPTPIQDQAIPHILQGRDVIGIANTGTGKTAAFLIPLINKVIKDRNNCILIVAPTRELAVQIKDEFYEFSRGLGIYCASCIGGAGIGRQQKELYRNPNFVIGTPGRLKDLVNRKSLNLSKFGTIVLDEADHMVDIGFINDIKFIIALLRQDRQSLFFSATIDGKVREVLNAFVKDPVTVSVKKGETAENIRQEVVKLSDPTAKIETLHQMLIKEEFDKVLVFCRTKHGVQRLSEDLNKRGFKSDAIHGNKRQSQRLRTLENFKRNNIQILIATDVASRGIDIPNVSHVINYDLPESREAYTHRIGRTGRADKTGIAITFV